MANSAQRPEDEGIASDEENAGRRVRDEDVFSEYHKWRQRVEELVGENFRLREREIQLQEKWEARRRESDLDFQERALQLQDARRRESDHILQEKALQLQEKKDARDARRRESDLDFQERELKLQEKKDAIDARRRESDLDFQERELQLQEKKLQLVKEMYAFKEQREADHRAKEHALQRPTVMKEINQWKKEAERLESENNDLKQKMSLSDCQGSVVGSVPGILSMISLSNMVGKCGKQCIVCGKEENRCTKCGLRGAEHCTCEPCDCPKEHRHKFDKQALRDSHAYSEGMLKRACGSTDEEVIWDATKGPKVAVRKPSNCCWSLLCKLCEEATSDIEKHVCERHDSKYYESLDEGLIHCDDITVFRAFTYRAMPVNTNLSCFMDDSSEKERRATGRVLRALHQAFSDAEKQKGCTECGYRKANHCTSEEACDCDKEHHPFVRQRPPSTPVKACEAGMLFVYHHSKDGHNIEFPFLCEVDLSAAGLGHHWLVYGQMPPYYWAFPLDADQATVLQPHFRSIIRSVNFQLELEREEYYQQCSEAEQRRGMMKLVVGYLRKLNKCCVRVTIDP